MKNKKGIVILICLILIILIVGGVILFLNNKNIPQTNENTQNIQVEYTQSELDSTWDKSSAVNIELSNNNITSSNTSKAEVSNNIVTIKTAGVYHLTGESSNAQIIIDSTKDDEIKLVLDNVNFTCTNSAPIFVKQADEVIITLEDGTTNIIVDGEIYELNEEDEPNAAIFSKDGLVINGNGTLNITSNFEDGIASKDNLKIISGTININANDDGIRGKDSVIIKNGNINIISNGDGIKTTNTDSQDVGYVVIEGGNITIDAVQDGIQAESNLNIKDGNLNIVTGGGSENSSSSNEAWGEWDKNSVMDFRNISGDKGYISNSNNQSSNNMPKRGNGKSNMQDGKMPDLNELPNMKEMPDMENLPNMNEIPELPNIENNTSTSNNETKSAKGIKAGVNITIAGGNFIINASDDSIHSNGTISITNGNFEISSGDDGVHADESLIIDNGLINITKSYEGIESAIITINNGEFYVVASDDGINVAGGNDGSSMNGRPGQNNMQTSNTSTQNLTVNNGYIYINASGDGIDINGSGYINGGTVLVDGPTNSGNGALDYAQSFIVNGGFVIAAGSSGMLQTSSNGSKINCISITFDSTKEAESLICITDSNDNEIVTYAPSKTYQSVVICSSEFNKGDTYKIYTGGASSKNNKDGLYELGGYENGTLFDEITINGVINKIGNRR